MYIIHYSAVHVAPYNIIEPLGYPTADGYRITNITPAALLSAGCLQQYGHHLVQQLAAAVVLRIQQRQETTYFVSYTPTATAVQE